MAGRATPPASVQPSVGSRGRQRPRFARIPSAFASTNASVSVSVSASSSASAAQAARSDESLTSALKSLALADGAKDPDVILVDGAVAGGDVRAPARPALGMSRNAIVCTPLLRFSYRSAAFLNSTNLPPGNTRQKEEQTHQHRSSQASTTCSCVHASVSTRRFTWVC